MLEKPVFFSFEFTKVSDQSIAELIVRDSGLSDFTVVEHDLPLPLITSADLLDHECIGPKLTLTSLLDERQDVYSTRSAKRAGPKKQRKPRFPSALDTPFLNAAEAKRARKNAKRLAANNS